MTQPEAMFLVSRSTFDAILAKLEEILIAVKRIPGGEPGVLVYRPRQYMELVQVSARTVYRRLARGEIPGVRMGGQWRIPAAAVREQLTQTVAARAPDPVTQEKHESRLVIPLRQDDVEWPRGTDTAYGERPPRPVPSSGPGGFCLRAHASNHLIAAARAAKR